MSKCALVLGHPIRTYRAVKLHPYLLHNSFLSSIFFFVYDCVRPNVKRTNSAVCCWLLWNLNAICAIVSHKTSPLKWSMSPHEHRPFRGCFCKLHTTSVSDSVCTWNKRGYPQSFETQPDICILRSVSGKYVGDQTLKWQTDIRFSTSNTSIRYYMVA